MIHAANTALNERPESFNRVGVNIAAHVDPLRVTNARVLIARWPEHVINGQFVSLDRGRWQHALDNVRHDVSAGSVFNRDGHDFPAALNHSENRNIVRVGAGSACNASLASATFPADVRFVHFDGRVTFKGFNILGHEFVTDFLRDAVRGLVGNAKLPLKLLRRDSATSARHEIHRIEPQMERRGRLMEDGSGSRGQMLSASLTRPSLTLLRVLVALKLALRFALRTGRVDTIVRVAIAPQELKASIIVRELFHKLHERILGVRRFGPFGLFSVYWWHSETMLAQIAYSVKG